MNGKRSGRACKHAQSHSTCSNLSPVAVFATSHSALRVLRSEDKQRHSWRVRAQIGTDRAPFLSALRGHSVVEKGGDPMISALRREKNFAHERAKKCQGSAAA